MTLSVLGAEDDDAGINVIRIFLHFSNGNFEFLR